MSTFFSITSSIEIATSGELFPQRDRVDDVTPFRETDHRAEQDAMRLLVEHRVVQELGRLTGVPTPVIDVVLALVRQRARLAGSYA